MKKLLIALMLACVCSFYSLIGHAAVPYDTVVSPAQPQAYQNFTVEFSGYNTSVEFADAVLVNIENNEIHIEYRSEDWAFLPYINRVATNIDGLAPGEYTLKYFRRILVSSDPGPSFESIVAMPEEMSIVVNEAPPAIPVFTLYHPDIRHYFITASEEEKNLITDYNMGDDQWYLADDGFNAWPADGPAPETAMPVCRFYSYIVNSHFYTANEEECEWLQSFDSGWEFEAVAFQALVPTAGACPHNTSPVWRLFNNRYAQLDSNHRFVIGQDTYRSMIAQGWRGEGIAFCSPPIEDPALDDE